MRTLRVAILALAVLGLMRVDARAQGVGASLQVVPISSTRVEKLGLVCGSRSGRGRRGSLRGPGELPRASRCHASNMPGHYHLRVRAPAVKAGSFSLLTA